MFPNSSQSHQFSDPSFSHSEGCGSQQKIKECVIENMKQIIDFSTYQHQDIFILNYVFLQTSLGKNKPPIYSSSTMLFFLIFAQQDGKLWVNSVTLSEKSKAADAKRHQVRVFTPLVVPIDIIKFRVCPYWRQFLTVYVWI